ncbi:MAG TPA: CBS domain-containing protein [Chloroflexota bacterium]|nr:CBS domain-containing protein [Chloroflexota bacterium]
MKAREIMNASPATVSPAARISDVARTVLREGDQGVPMVDGNGRLLGIVTEDDLVSKHARVHAPVYLGFLGGVLPLDSRRTKEELRHVLSVCARDIMSTDVPTASPETEVEDIASMMVEEKQNPVIILEGGRIVGKISHREIIQLLIQEEEDEGTDAGST